MSTPPDSPDFERRTGQIAARDTEVRTIERTTSGTLINGENEVETFTPPSGTLWELQGVSFQAFLTGGSGDHTFRLTPDIGNLADVIEYSFPGSEDLFVQFNEAENAGAASNLYPGSPSARVENIRSVVVDEDTPLELAYENNTGQDQPLGRFYFLSVIQRRVE